MKRFILPILLVGVMVSVVGVLGFILVQYAVDIANKPRPFSYDEMEKMLDQPRVGDKDIERLLACFERNDEDLRLKAAEVLAKNSKQSLDPLRVKLKDKNAKVRYIAVQAFAFMPADESAPAAGDLAACLDDSDADVRRKAVYVIGRIGPRNDEAFNGLIKALNDADAGVVATAIESLQKVDAPPKGALPALTKLAQDADHQRRTAAIKLLGKMGEPAVPAFKDLLSKSNAAEHFVLYEAIIPLGKSAKPLLPELNGILLKNPWWDNEEKLFTIYKNCGADGAQSLAEVLKSLHDPKSPHFAAANDRARTLLKVLGEIGSPAAVATPVLVGLLKDHAGLRAQVLETLGDIGPAAKEAIPVVQGLTDDPMVGEAARRTLKRMGVLK